jgi:hypothetical protein
MSEIFLSYRFTGEKPETLEYLLGNIKSSLETANHTVSCSFHWEQFFRDEGMTNDEIYAYCLEKQKGADIFMPFLKSNDESYGMKIESDKAIELGQKYVTLNKLGVIQKQFYKPANQIIVYSSFQGLFEMLKTFK